ncbi:MAG: NAD-dependent epimerase/dehydratase family protein [Alphaproteobacteria bacterium]|nr:NAD-dependent epimerase/dehydratase family protein [Alphaproteobacteria bacterium]
MHVFVTGGSGFVGGHLIEFLVGRGDTVSAMARSQRSADAVAAFGATPVRCSLDDLAAEHLVGVDAVVHAAAFVQEHGTRAAFEAANVHGTQRVIDAVRAAGVPTLVHIGTEAAVFDGHDLVDIDEAAPYPTRQRFLYSETKAEAERRVLAAHGDGLRALSLRPRLIWGPRDSSVLPAVLEMAAQGRFSWLDGGRQPTSTTHVANLVHAIGLALDGDVGGVALFVADDGQTTVREFLTALAATRGVQLPSRSVPGALARPLSTLVEGAWSALGLSGPPPMTAFAVHMMSRTVTVDDGRARALLGYAPVIGRDEGIRALGAA